MMEPKEGRLTFRAEGNNNPSSMYYSRKIHWPGNSGSGVTIGRGYDLGSRPKFEVLGTLLCVGLGKERAEKLALGAGLKGRQADDFVRKNKDNIGEITESEQKQLFENIYKEYSDLAESFYNKAKNNRKLVNAISWGKLNPVLKDVFIDMRYQGVLDGEMVRAFASNNKDDVIKLIQNTQILNEYERNRNRIKYIEVNLK